MLLGAALLMRLWGTWYGLPFSYHKDEYHEVMRALELGAGGFNLNRTSKGGFYYLLFFEYGLYFLFQKFTGAVATAQDFAKAFVRDPSAFYLIGRVTAALLGSITVAAVFYLARRAYSTTAGLLAALFLSVNVLHIDLSRIIGVDVPMTMLATFALLFALRIAETGRRADYLLAALFAALATTTKLPGILVLPPLLIAHTYFVAKSGSGLRGWFGMRDLWLGAAVFVLVLVATNPGIVFQPGFLSLFSQPSQEMVDDAAISAVVEGGSSRPNLYTYYLTVLQASMGWPLFALGLVSVAYAIRKRTPADVILLSYALINYLIISSTTSDTLYYPRYALPIIVVSTVLAGRALADVAGFIARQRIATTAIIVAVCIALPVGQSIATAHALSRPDTRTMAMHWFEDNVPAESRILIEGGKIGPDRGTVPLRDSRASLQRRIAHWKVAEPRQAKFLELKLAVHEGGGYDLEFLDLDSATTLDAYAANGVEYFVVRPKYFINSRRADEGSARLVSELHSDVRIKLIKRFEGDERAQLSPTIEIYRLQRGRSTSRN